MQTQSQAELEHQLEQRSAQVESGQLSPEQAYGTLDDWIIQLGERKAFLHPNLKQWMWYDKLHDEWVFAGCGVGEAILLTIGRLGGIKKLHQAGEVDGWCIYQQGQAIQGPLRIEEVRDRLKRQEVPKDILIWSTRATDWLRVSAAEGLEIFFTNKSGESVLKVNDRGQFSEPSPKAKSAHRKKST